MIIKWVSLNIYVIGFTYVLNQYIDRLNILLLTKTYRDTKPHKAHAKYL